MQINTWFENQKMQMTCGWALSRNSRAELVCLVNLVSPVNKMGRGGLPSKASNSVVRCYYLHQVSLSSETSKSSPPSTDSFWRTRMQSVLFLPIHFFHLFPEFSRLFCCFTGILLSVLSWNKILSLRILHLEKPLDSPSTPLNTHAVSLPSETLQSASFIFCWLKCCLLWTKL